MVNLVIAGLPKNVKIPKFVNYLEKTVFHENVNARLVHTMHVDNNIKNITLGLKSVDARKARRFLDGLRYQYAGKEFLLQCWQNETDNIRQVRDKEEMMDFTTSGNDNDYYAPESSQNPSMLRRDLEEIDLKIEIVRKQRILLEEENKLLLAQKKAEYLSKIGPNDYDNLIKLEKVCGLKDLKEIPKLQPTPATAKSPNVNANTNSNANAKKKNNTRLPNFKAPCRVIVKEMADVLDNYVKPENRDLVMSLIFSAIRKRLILVLQGQGFLPAPDIVHLYRVKYPHSTDKNLLEELMETITQSFWPKTPSVDANDNGNGQVKTKIEVTDATVVNKKDENNDDVKIIIDDKVIDDNSSKTGDKVENKQEPVDNKEVLVGNNQEPVNDKFVQSLDNVDGIVDMDNDLDEWDDNENENEGELNAEKDTAKEEVEQ